MFTLTSRLAGPTNCVLVLGTDGARERALAFNKMDNSPGRALPGDEDFLASLEEMLFPTTTNYPTRPQTNQPMLVADQEGQRFETGNLGQGSGGSLVPFQSEVHQAAGSIDGPSVSGQHVKEAGSEVTQRETSPPNQPPSPPNLPHLDIGDILDIIGTEYNRLRD